MYSKANPFLAKIKERRRLTSPNSSKATYHVELSVDETFTFRPGDSIAALASNDPEMVDAILKKLKVLGETPIQDKTGATHSIRDYLLHKANISKVSFHKLFDTPKTALPLIDLLDQHTVNIAQLVSVLPPLLPRFYSIASSLKTHPNEVHLTVELAQTEINGRVHYGVASHYLCVQPQKTVPIYVQPTRHFLLPEDDAKPIILIGPGTGVAPFRAFLQERLAQKASGANWLFFGERNRSSDFYYEELWSKAEKESTLKLDTAFSRDQEHKIYVQHKMQEKSRELWQWIQNKAHIYICGDAERMAGDVEKTLLQILEKEGSLTEESAKLLLKEMRREKRYLLDVY